MSETTTTLSPLALAFLGDAIHTAYVRKKVLDNPNRKLNELNREAKSFCNASAQAEVLDRLIPTLTEDELNVVRHARNTKNKHTAKNFDEKTYKKATSFEALVGWLFLTDQRTRLGEILAEAMREGDGDGRGASKRAFEV